MMMMTSDGGAAGADGAGLDNSAASGGADMGIVPDVAAGDLVATAAAAAAAMESGDAGDEDTAGAEGGPPAPEIDGTAVTAAAVAAAEAVKETAAQAAADVAGADAVAPPAPAVFASSGGEFVSKEHRRAGPFKAVLLYLDYVRWLWNVTDKERLDREQGRGVVSERVKVMVMVVMVVVVIVTWWGKRARQERKKSWAREANAQIVEGRMAGSTVSWTREGAEGRLFQSWDGFCCSRSAVVFSL